MTIQTHPDNLEPVGLPVHTVLWYLPHMVV